MPRRSARLLTAVICAQALAPTGFAQSWSEQLSRTVEAPSHQWLERRRSAPDAQLSPFTTDGCSGGMSSLWSFMAEQYPDFAKSLGGRPPWESCCVAHDQVYHNAGDSPDAEASYDARLEADQALRRCVAATDSDKNEILRTEYGLSDAQIRAAYKAIAAGMFQAVRLGGGPCTGLPWRWGYGYPQCWNQPEQ